jgi:hypothetical protein
VKPLGSPSDFQSELELQQSGTQQTSKEEPEPAGLPNNLPGKRGSSKTGKKRNTPDAANLAAVTPVQVTEPQKQILPLAWALAPPQDLAQQPEMAQQQKNAKPDGNAKASDKARPGQASQDPVQQAGQVPTPSVAAVAQLPELRQPAALKPSAKPRQSPQSVQAPSNQIAAAGIAPSATLDFSKVQIVSLAARSSAEIPMRVEDATKPADPTSQDLGQAKVQGQAQLQVRAQDQAQDEAQNQAQKHAMTTSAKPSGSADTQPISLADLKLHATPAEPIATAVQETGVSASSGPSALAFAARLAVAPQNTVDAGAAPPSQSPAVSGSPTAVQIPVRYAATAQIIQSATLRNEPGTQPGTQQGGPKKDPLASSAPSTRSDARTDMVLPQFETVSQSAGSSGSTAPQQTALPARAESIIEPPVAPPTSSHDIRVQVPDNKGGSTQIRFVESGGEVRVSVRTADEGLAQNLRSHLNDLTQRLSDGGMPAEIWKPAPNAAAPQNDSHQPSQEGGGSGGQGSGGQSGQEERQQKRPAWLDEMEASLQGEQS